MLITEVVKGSEYTLKGSLLLTGIAPNNPQRPALVQQVQALCNKLGITCQAGPYSITWQYSSSDTRDMLYRGDEMNSGLTKFNGNWDDRGNVNAGPWKDLKGKLDWDQTIENPLYGIAPSDYDTWRNDYVFRNFG